MVGLPDSTEQLEAICSSHGFGFQNLQNVREAVYRGSLQNRTVAGSSEVFVKIHPTKRRKAFEEFVEIATDVGHPECCLFIDDQLYIVMGVADGRPLSQLLPIAFLPGLWNIRKQRYEQVYHKLGTQLGQLHTATERRPGPLLSDSKQDSALEHTLLLNTKFNSSLVEKVQTLLRRASDYQVPYAVTYGDRSPHNIFFDGSSVSQIDFAGKHRSTVYEHTNVLVGIRLMHNRLPYASSKANLEQAYWEGYKQTGITPIPTDEEIAIRCLERYLHLLSFYQSGVSSLNSKITQLLDPPILLGEINRTITQIPL